MPEQLRIERRYDDWFEIGRAHFLQLPAPLFQIVCGMRVGHLLGRLAIVQFLVITSPGNSMILNPHEPAHTAPNKIDIFQREIESDVAIKIPVSRVARISTFRAPDLTTRFTIAREDGWARQREIWRVNRAARARFAKHDAMRIQDRPPNVRFS